MEHGSKDLASLASVAALIGCAKKTLRKVLAKHGLEPDFYLSSPGYCAGNEIWLFHRERVEDLGALVREYNKAIRGR
jgi:hypothetical protein